MKLTSIKKHSVNPTKLDTDDSPVNQKKRSPFVSGIVKVFAFLIPVGIIVALVPYLIMVSSAILQPFFKAANFTVNGNSAAFESMKREPTLRTDANGFTNALIVGIDTREKGSRLLNTDTIILASYNHKTNEVAMVSFPRDLTVNYPGTPSFGKINATYAYGELRKSGAGIEYLKQLIESISGQKIHYHVMVDLKGFTTIIDQLGGIEVSVDTAFSGDYPTPNHRWIRVTFPKGVNKMNGERALQFSRIRFAYPGSEASDFARARRQQKVIQAVVDKATKVETLQNTQAIFEIMSTVASHIKVNRVTPEDVEAGLSLLAKKGKPATFSLVLDPSAGGRYGRLITRGQSTLYTIEPSAGRNNWSQVKAFLKDYAAFPGLVTLDKNVTVYNKGKENYLTVYNNLRNRYYYTNFVNGGTPKDLPEPGVYNIGGTSSETAAQYLATSQKLPYITVDETISVPKPKDTAIVIVMGK